MRSRCNGWNKEREDTDDCNINPLGLYLHLTNGTVKKRMPRKCAPHRALAKASSHLLTDRFGILKAPFG